MKRKTINLLALLIIGAGFALTSMAAPAPGASPNMIAKCQSGDDQYSCQGTYCTAGYDWCCGSVCKGNI